MIERLPWVFDVSQAQKELENEDVWNRHPERKAAYVHRVMDDIWVRYAESIEAGLAPHVSQWYPVVTKIPAVWSLVRKMNRRVPGELGGVLITRIPPGGRIERHEDHGWHAEYYEKYAIQIKGDQDQAFCFDSGEVRANDGESYTFNNQFPHWVTNDSDRERITLIICIKASKDAEARRAYPV